MTEVDQWLKRLGQVLKGQTGRGDIEVTGGPYRGYDVRVEQAEDGHPIVDFYSPIRYDGREQDAIEYAVSLLKGWDSARASIAAERVILQPIADRIQVIFPEYEINFATGDYQEHFVQLERSDDKVIASFDLWPALNEAGIQHIVDSIKQCADRMTEKSLVVGIHYGRPASEKRRSDEVN